MTVVCVDTTEFFQAPRLDRAGWPELLTWSRSGAISVAVSEVVLREADRHHKEKALKDLEVLRIAAGKFDYLKRGRQFDLNPLAAELDVSIADQLDERRRMLAEHGVSVMPLPTVSHERLLERDLARGKPFQESGKGYRDALAWESLLEFLRDQPAEHVLLVSGDSDFGGRRDKRALDRTLADEITALGHRVELFESLTQAVETLRESVVEKLHIVDGWPTVEEGPNLDELVSEAVVTAAEGLAGKSVAEETEDGRFMSPGVVLYNLVPRDFSDPSIADVDVDAQSVVVDIYDRYDGDTFAMHVELNAELEIEGFAYKSDFYTGIDDATIIDAGWNDQMMWLSVSRQCRLRFYATVVGSSVEDVTFDAGEPI